MTTEIEKDIDLVVQHFLLDDEKSSTDVTNALMSMGRSRPFEALGRAMYLAMLKTYMASLQAEKATLVVKNFGRRFTNGDA